MKRLVVLALLVGFTALHAENRFIKTVNEQFVSFVSDVKLITKCATKPQTCTPEQKEKAKKAFASLAIKTAAIVAIVSASYMAGRLSKTSSAIAKPSGYYCMRSLDRDISSDLKKYTDIAMQQLGFGEVTDCSEAKMLFYVYSPGNRFDLTALQA